MVCFALMQGMKKKERKKKVQKLPTSPLLCLSSSSPPFSNTLCFLQAAISTKLVPRVLIAVYEAHLLARESVFV